MINLDRILEIRDTALVTKFCLVKAMVFPVVMYGCEIWTTKKAEHWRIDAFELWCWRRLESPLDCKEIKPVNPKENQYRIFIGRANGEAEIPILWTPDVKNWVLRKDPDAGKCWREEKKGMRWMTSLTRWAWIWASSGSWWRTGRPGMLQSMGLQRIGHDWVTELTEHQQEFTGGSDCRCVRNSKRTRVRSVTLRCDWIAAISWKKFNRWGVASYWWVNKVVSWERSCSWWRCCEDCEMTTEDLEYYINLVI